jgi:hypothetical protein
VHDQRDDSEDQKDVDEKAADVEHEKATKPKENQDDCQDQEHESAALLEIERNGNQ